MLPTDYAARKDFPLLTVLTAYFPDAVEALVELCKAGNVQHDVGKDAVNPFTLPTDRVTWDRSKSTEQMETLMRHAWDHMRAKRGVGSVFDTDGHLHIIKTFWRAGAEAQLVIEAIRQELSEATGSASAPKPTTLLDIQCAGHGPDGPGPDINGDSPTDPLPVMLGRDLVADGGPPAEAWTRGTPVPKGRYVRPDGNLSELHPEPDPLYRDLPTL